MGIDWENRIDSTIEKNYKKILSKCKKSIENAPKTILTIHQKTTFFNCFIAPKVGYMAKILPIPTLFNQQIQSAGYALK